MKTGKTLKILVFYVRISLIIRILRGRGYYTPPYAAQSFHPHRHSRSNASGGHAIASAQTKIQVINFPMVNRPFKQSQVFSWSADMRPAEPLTISPYNPGQGVLFRSRPARARGRLPEVSTAPLPFAGRTSGVWWCAAWGQPSIIGCRQSPQIRRIGLPERAIL